MAADPPMPESTHAEHRSFLERNGCDRCDEDDPDRLESREPNLPNCSAMQYPPRKPILCDDCFEERPSFLEKQIRQAERRDNSDNFPDVVGLAVYTCGNTWLIEDPEVPTQPVEKQIGDRSGEPVYEKVEVPIQGARPTATLNCECRCGAGIEEIVTIDTGEV